MTKEQTDFLKRIDEIQEAASVFGQEVTAKYPESGHASLVFGRTAWVVSEIQTEEGNKAVAYLYTSFNFRELKSEFKSVLFDHPVGGESLPEIAREIFEAVDKEAVAMIAKRETVKFIASEFARELGMI